MTARAGQRHAPSSIRVSFSPLPPMVAWRPRLSTRVCRYQAPPTAKTTINPSASARAISGGYVNDNSRTMRTASTSIWAPLPMIAGTENNAKPNHTNSSTEAPRLGCTAGSVTRRMVRISPLPQMRDCSSSAESTLRRPALTSRYT